MKRRPARLWALFTLQGEWIFEGVVVATSGARARVQAGLSLLYPYRAVQVPIEGGSLRDFLDRTEAKLMRKTR